ncbi:hypothetical protein B0J18DRAFT_438072 [Chaetomium sp. MPI-SDFR-AT-0129]|nr:hypothetical protein B0J18DRAFT_438072 [Chaetomium sp. MPI-SDFR-AT-0129]
MPSDFKKVPSYRDYPLKDHNARPPPFWSAVCRYPGWRHEQDVPHEDAEEAQLLCVLLMLANLKSLETNILGEVELKSVGVVVGEQLDVDETTWDLTSQQYFQPWALKEVLEESVDSDKPSDYWVVGWKLEDREGWWADACQAYWCHDRLREVNNLSSFPMGQRWFDSKEIFASMRAQLPHERGTLVNEETGERVPYEYRPNLLWFQFFEKKPHVGCVTSDTSTAPPTEGVLFSVIEYTLELIKYRLWMGRHTGSHTKPIMLVTLQGHEFAILTIAYFDGNTNKLVLRQSRQLDLRGGKPTPDAFLLGRWIASRCVGETRYKDVVEYEDKLEGRVRRDWRYSNGGRYWPYNA